MQRTELVSCCTDDIAFADPYRVPMRRAAARDTKWPAMCLAGRERGTLVTAGSPQPARTAPWCSQHRRGTSSVSGWIALNGRGRCGCRPLHRNSDATPSRATWEAEIAHTSPRNHAHFLGYSAARGRRVAVCRRGVSGGVGARRRLVRGDESDEATLGGPDDQVGAVPGARGPAQAPDLSLHPAQTQVKPLRDLSVGKALRQQRQQPLIVGRGCRRGRSTPPARPRPAWRPG